MNHDFKQIAQAYWTPERVQKLTGGKKWLLLPDEAADFLRAVGLMNKDASISWDSMRKYSQINHMLQVIEASLADQVKRHPVVHILDAGCGTSFLSLAVAWYLKEKIKHPFKIIGIDSNAKVIATSSSRATAIGVAADCQYLKSEIPESSLTLFSGPGDLTARPHIVIALHACDTATDYAIALGIKDKADVIAVAPCCQRELSDKMKKDNPREHPLHPVYASPNIRRDLAANFTDSLRLLHLRSRGYEVTATEFVPSEHTPKNRLLLALRRGNWHEESKQQLQQVTDHIGGHTIKLAELLNC